MLSIPPASPLPLPLTPFNMPNRRVALSYISAHFGESQDASMVSSHCLGAALIRLNVAIGPVWRAKASRDMYSMHRMRGKSTIPTLEGPGLDSMERHKLNSAFYTTGAKIVA
jgi:hypothetical protein